MVADLMKRLARAHHCLTIQIQRPARPHHCQRISDGGRSESIFSCSIPITFTTCGSGRSDDTRSECLLLLLLSINEYGGVDLMLIM